MKIKDIVVNSQYLTDESIADTTLLAITNGGIAHINTEAGCNLPLATTENLQTTSYDAFSDSWQLRLLEPYICFSIMSNDTNDNATSFHFNRFLSSMDSFIKKGLGSIKLEDENGDATGYEGDSERVFEVDQTDSYIDWGY
jgi:hypothetical protein